MTMTARVSVERSPAFDAPWLVFGPVDGRVLLLAYFYDWAEAIRYAHHYATRHDERLPAVAFVDALGREWCLYA